MKRLPLAWALVAATGLLILHASAAPQDDLDPVKVSPQTVKVLFENEWVRVLEAKVPPSGHEPKHRHLPGVAVFLTHLEVESVSFPDGKVAKTHRKFGAALWHEPTVHEVRNVGKTPVHTIRVELKD